MVVKIATSEPPTELTTVRIATPMPAAIRPHSIAVTPLRSPVAFQAKDLSSILRACFKLAPAPDYSSLNGPHFSSVAKRLSKSTVAPATKTNVGGSLRVYWLMITDLRSFA
jgi:hypothetical protein